MIKWTSSREEMELESKIADKAIAMAQENGIALKKLETVMDIDACHMNGNPLKLAGLLAADPLDFAHDVIGIINHIDRKTGKLKDCFSPRYSL